MKLVIGLDISTADSGTDLSLPPTIDFFFFENEHQDILIAIPRLLI